MPKHKGTIKFFSYRRGYGFIINQNIKEDIFFHFSSISNLPGMVVYLIPGENVEFDLIKGPRGFLAKNVTSRNKVKKNFDRKVNSIYYHYYYSFRKIMDGMIENVIDKEKDI